MRRLYGPRGVLVIFLLLMMAFGAHVGIPLRTVIGDALVRLVMNGVLMLSLVPMLNAGVGINFGLPLGILAGLLGICLAINWRLTHLGGFLGALCFATPIRERAELLGVEVDAVRLRAMVVSTAVACLGQIAFLQNIGMMNVYTAHLNTDLFACAALLAGGATITEARLRHVFIGIVLFHTLFIVSQQAGQNLFTNAALGEYFRSFIAYGTIALALVLNLARPTTP